MSASPQLAPVAAAARFHRPELDALRFSAFLLVFLHHALPHASSAYAGLPQALGQLLAAAARAGALGVDLFFALSAYLITELLLREHRATGSLDIRAFYTRRILRIWPLYYAALLVLAPLLDPLPAGYTAAFALLAGNWMAAFQGYPASSFALLWSVSIEEQFYLAWPWLVRRSVRHVRTWAYAMLAIASGARLTLALLGSEHPSVWCNTLARLDPIAGGILLASYLNGSLPNLRTPWRGALVAGGLFGLFTAGAAGEHAGWGALLTYPVAALSSVAILYGTLGLGCRVPALLYLGRISFGLYVFHAVVLRWVVLRWLPSIPVAFAATVAIAALSYRYLETPFLRLKERFARVQSRPA